MSESLPFETKGGSPTVVEVRTPDGQLWRLRIALTVLEVVHAPEIPNPNDPEKPTFRVNLSLPIETQKVEPQ